MSSELARRIGFAVVAAPLAVAVVYFGDAALATLLAAIAAVGAWELFRIARGGGNEPLVGLGVALAALLPQSADVPTAARAAKDYLTAALQAANELDVGKGHGPVHHFHALWRER